MISSDVELADDVRIFQPTLVNLYGCRIGENTRIGAFVEIQRGAVIGSHCKISSHSFVCAGVTIEDGVFIGHGVMFINDLYPRATNPDGSLQTDTDWTLVPTEVSVTMATMLINATIRPYSIIVWPSSSSARSP